MAHRKASVKVIFEYEFEDVDELFGADLSDAEMLDAINEEVELLAYKTLPDHTEVTFELVEDDDDPSETFLEVMKPLMDYLMEDEDEPVPAQDPQD